MSDASPFSFSPFLRLPMELRVLIYSFIIFDNAAVTISAAELVGSHYEITSRLYDVGVEKYWGLPHNHEPVLEETYDASLLSVTNPTLIPVSTTPRRAKGWLKRILYNARTTLLLVSRKVSSEVNFYFPGQTPQDTRFFVLFPYGLHVLQSMMNERVLHRARSVHIAGIYTPRDFSARHAAYLPHLTTPSGHRIGVKYNPDQAGQLAALILSCLSPTQTHTVRLFEMRIYYPGEDSYSTIWGDDSGPLCVALRKIQSGRVLLEVWRGQYGTAVYLRARPSNDGKRDVSTVWKRLEEGRRGQPSIGTWVVDPRWPDCDD